MGRRRGPRLKNGLPRGGLGWIGWVPALASLAVALLVRVDVALGATLLALPVCVWCMVGLRRDAAAGEVMDHYVDDDSFNWAEMLSGNFEHPVRRQSHGLLLFGLLGCAVALARWVFGWGPVL
jgi:hypothetical protein